MTVFDKLNLRPAERRAVVVVALVVFVALNFFFVWPKFFDYGKIQNRRKQAEGSLQQFQREVQRIPEYERKLRDLEKQGAAVASEDQALKLSTTVYSQAALSGVQVNTYTPVLRGGSMGGKTNQFFDEQSGTIQFVAEEKNLVDFLYNLGAGGSMIRVRSMTLNPDPPHQRLQGSITLVASYARKAPVRNVGGSTGPAPSVPTGPGRPGTTALPPPGGARPGITAALKAPESNAPPQKTSWLARLWPFGKKAAAPVVQTNAPGRTNAPAAAPKK